MHKIRTSAPKAGKQFEKMEKEEYGNWATAAKTVLEQTWRS
jgi:hypothetical protein